MTFGNLLQKLDNREISSAIKSYVKYGAFLKCGKLFNEVGSCDTEGTITMICLLYVILVTMYLLEDCLLPKNKKDLIHK